MTGVAQGRTGVSGVGGSGQQSVPLRLRHTPQGIDRQTARQLICRAFQHVGEALADQQRRQRFPLPPKQTAAARQPGQKVHQPPLRIRQLPEIGGQPVSRAPPLIDVQQQGVDGIDALSQRQNIRLKGHP